MDLKTNEKIIRNGRANHLRASGGIGGKLFLTNQRLFFKPHLFNHDRSEETITLENIKSIVAPHSDSISKKLAITLNNELIEFFVVGKRREWIKEIEKAVFRVKKDRNIIWHNAVDSIQDIERASRFALRKIIIQAIIGGIITGFLMFMFL